MIKRKTEKEVSSRVDKIYITIVIALLRFNLFVKVNPLFTDCFPLFNKYTLCHSEVLSAREYFIPFDCCYLKSRFRKFFVECRNKRNCTCAHSHNKRGAVLAAVKNACCQYRKSDFFSNELFFRSRPPSRVYYFFAACCIEIGMQTWVALNCILIYARKFLNSSMAGKMHGKANRIKENCGVCLLQFENGRWSRIFFQIKGKSRFCRFSFLIYLSFSFLM